MRRRRRAGEDDAPGDAGVQTLASGPAPAPSATSRLLGLARSLAAAGDAEALLAALSAALLEVYGPGDLMWLSTEGQPPSSYRLMAYLHAGDPLPGDPSERPTLSRGLVADLVGRPEPRVELDIMPGPDPLLGHALTVYRSVLLTPIAAEGESGWLLYFQTSAAPAPEGVLPALMLGNLFLAHRSRLRDAAALREARAWIDAELEQLAQVQRALLPDGEPPVPGVRYAASFRPRTHAAGDYYDVVALPQAEPHPDGTVVPRRWGVMVADAAGHGPAAAVEVAMLDAILRTYPGPSQGPAAVFTYANRHLFTRRIRGTFITAFAASYNPASRVLTYASAGHVPALLWRPGRKPWWQVLEGATGIPLGVSPEFAWHNAEEALRPGDCVVLYTDGLTEATDKVGRAFGLDGLIRALSRAGGKTPADLVAALERAVDLHQGPGERRDDQTVVVVQVE